MKKCYNNVFVSRIGCWSNFLGKTDVNDSHEWSWFINSIIFLEPKWDELFKHSKLKLRIMMRRTFEENWHWSFFFLERSFILLVRLFTEKRETFLVYRKRVFLTIEVNFVQKHTHANKPKKMLKETYWVLSSGIRIR